MCIYIDLKRSEYDKKISTKYDFLLYTF